MRIIIKTIVKEQNGKIVITGITSIGEIRGNWKSPNEPEKGNEYDVELSIPELKGDEVLVLKEYNLISQTIVGTDGKTYFQGTCEFVDEDDIYVVRFAVNWIEMIEIDMKKVNIGDVILFSIFSDQIDIFPL